MKKFLKITAIIIAAIILLFVIVTIFFYVKRYNTVRNDYALLGKEASFIKKDGKSFRDLNKNGKLDIYEDYRQPVEKRVMDLMDQMTIEEKAGTMFVTMIGMTPEGEPCDMPILGEGMMELIFSVMLSTNSELIAKKGLNSFNVLSAYDAKTMAHYNNQIQKLAERTRLGIPITLATDPRHGTENNPGASIYTPAFSQWPSPLGLAATRDTNLVRDFGDIARREYMAVGMRLTLSPMADLATEPRWGRINGTFGEDAELAAQMVKAHVLGFQDDTLSKNSVACMTKHFSGGGPQKDGEDPHFPYGKEQVYPGNNFDYHVIPFIKGAFPAHTAAIMPYYGIPVDQTPENVAFAFNKAIITKLLRDSLNFDGVVCTDWNIIRDASMGPARAWGVENLTEIQRVKKVIDAGCDQFGGEQCPELIVKLVETGQVPEERIDQSVRRILRDKFILGLFDNPYVDENAADKIAGKPEFRKKGKEAQAKSVVLLKNTGLLPLKSRIKIYAKGMLNPETLGKYGKVVDNIDDADVIVERINTPYDKRDKYLLENFFHQGRLYYTDGEKQHILALTQEKPVIVVVNLERPAILTEIDKKSAALLVDFGLSDDVMTEILFGKYNPSGKLPFELPSSWDAVLKQEEDMPYDSENPLYPFGYGLSYN